MNIKNVSITLTPMVCSMLGCPWGQPGGKDQELVCVIRTPEGRVFGVCGSEPEPFLLGRQPGPMLINKLNTLFKELKDKLDQEYSDYVGKTTGMRKKYTETLANIYEQEMKL